NNLNFQLYKDPARTTIWGSQFSGTPTHLIVNITIPGRGVLSTPPVVRTGTATLYGRVLGGQHLSRWLISVCGVCAWCEKVHCECQPVEFWHSIRFVEHQGGCEHNVERAVL